MMFPAKTVYLAGPISGLTHDEARHGWREQFSALLPHHIHGLSPMRGKEFLAGAGVIAPDVEYEHLLATDSGITTRDVNDVKTSDAVVACFLEGSGIVSIGTMIEIGLAHAFNKPIVLIAAEDDPHRCHPMVRRMAGYLADDLESGATVTTHLLTPGL